MKTKITFIIIGVIILITLLGGWTPIFEALIEIVGLAIYLIAMVFIGMVVMVWFKKIKK